jgi:hypothetical protein
MTWRSAHTLAVVGAAAILPACFGDDFQGSGAPGPCDRNPGATECVDPQSIGGGGSTANAGSTGGGGVVTVASSSDSTGVSTTTGQGGGGSGGEASASTGTGGGPCLGCNAVVFEPGGEASDLCSASVPIYDALADCICVTGCADECEANVCMGIAASDACQACVLGPCLQQAKDCQDDA